MSMTGAESIVYSARTVTQRSSFTKPGFKNQVNSEQTITIFKFISLNSLKNHKIEGIIKNYLTFLALGS